MALAKAIAILYSRKLSRNGEKYNFRCGENFRGLLTFAMPKDATPQNFVEKTCVNSHKTTKFAKVFSLKSFPLYVTGDDPFTAFGDGQSRNRFDY